MKIHRTPGVWPQPLCPGILELPSRALELCCHVLNASEWRSYQEPRCTLAASQLQPLALIPASTSLCPGKSSLSFRGSFPFPMSSLDLFVLDQRQGSCRSWVVRRSEGVWGEWLGRQSRGGATIGEKQQLQRTQDEWSCSPTLRSCSCTDRNSGVLLCANSMIPDTKNQYGNHY